MERPLTSTPITPPEHRFIRRLVSAIVILWLLQFGTTLWFMVGQGYDRTTAELVPWGGLTILPLMAWLIRTGMPAMAASRVAAIGQALATALVVYLLGAIGPSWVVLNLIDLNSPFSEYWWMIGLSSVSLAAMLTVLKTPPGRQWRFGTLLAGGGAVGVLLMRVIIFSVF